MKSFFRKKYLKRFICCLLVLLLTISTIPSAFAETTVYDSEPIIEGTFQEQIKLPDLGIDINHISNANVERVNEISNEMAELAGICNAVDDAELKTNSAAVNALSIASARIQALEGELLELGAIKLTEEQKMKYIYGTEWNGENQTVSTTASIPGINYPAVSGIDFYIFEYTVNWGEGDYDMVNCIASPTADVASKMVVEYDWVDMYEDVSIKSLAQKSIRFTANEISSNVLTTLTGGTITFLAGLLWDLAGNTYPSKTSASEGSLSLKVTSSSRVIHYWVKVNGTYYFRLSTCAAVITESWLLTDVNGKHYYKSNEYWAYSKYHSTGGDERAAAIGTSEWHGISIPYKAKGLLLWSTKVTVEPYTAALPIHFAS